MSSSSTPKALNRKAATRSPNDSGTVATHLVMPSDTNMHGTAFGGTIIAWMDIAASVAATRHCGLPSVTASIDDLSFERPIKMGDIVILKACVNYTGKSSMEVGVRVDREDPLTLTREHALSGYFTFVAVDGQGRPTPVPALLPLTDNDRRRYQAASKRHERRVLGRAQRLDHEDKLTKERPHE